jgi:hypothetical protein
MSNQNIAVKFFRKVKQTNKQTNKQTTVIDICATGMQAV